MEAVERSGSMAGLSDVADALQAHLLPLLSVKALACLACSSRQLKLWAYGSDGLWGAAARCVLLSGRCGSILFKLS